MLTVLTHEFVVQLYLMGERLRPIQQVPVGRDAWTPALESTRFDAIRGGAGSALLLPTGPGTIEPVWDSELSEPYIGGFRVTMPSDGANVSSEFPVDYFEDLAKQIVQNLKAAGQVPADQSCRFLVCAFDPQTEVTSADEPASRWDIKPVPQPLVLDSSLALSDLVRESRPCGPLDDDDLPVFIPEEVLDEAVALHEQAGAAETGGNLIGHLHRDLRHPGTFFVQVTAQLPAQNAQQELTRLTFTPDTWANLDGVIKLRGGNERKLGWWHTHPARKWCENCPVENRKRCKASGDFFSTHDSALHRAVYPMAFSIALVISDSYAEGLTFPLFAWRKGQLVRRGFYRLKRAGVAVSV